MRGIAMESKASEVLRSGASLPHYEPSLAASRWPAASPSLGSLGDPPVPLDWAEQNGNRV